MSDEDFRSYVGSYRNLVVKSLGEKYSLQARGFETLVIAERGQSLSDKSITKMRISVKALLVRALTGLTLTPEFRSSGKHLSGWQKEIEEAGLATELGVICRRISDSIFEVKTALV